MAWTSFDRPAALFRYSNTGGRNDDEKIHPTQKPIELYRWILGKYANPGYIILDTHVGSGSSLIACRELGYQYVGFELDETYFTAAYKRIENHYNFQRKDDIEEQLSIRQFMDLNK